MHTALPYAEIKCLLLCIELRCFTFVLVSVKWSGKKFDDIELDVSQPGLVFKTQLYTLTGVEPDRQKIMIKGGTLKVFYCIFCVGSDMPLKYVALID
jgi:hypothetical protein